jgi:hypothetical protein
MSIKGEIDIRKITANSEMGKLRFLMVFSFGHSSTGIRLMSSQVEAERKDPHFQTPIEFAKRDLRDLIVKRSVK